MSQSEKSLKSSARVEPEEFRRRVSEKAGVEGIEVKFGQVVATVAPERVVETLSVLKNDPDLACDYFNCLSAIDWEDEGFELLVIVNSTTNLNTVILKSRLGPGKTNTPSVTSVYPGANWHERECAEMFGLTFEGHPNPQKLYLPVDFEGHPLRKSFKLASRTYKPWPGAKDPAEAESGGR